MVAMAAVAGHRARGIEGGVLVEEAERLEPERNDVDWHDRPVLDSRDVVDAEDVPQHYIGSHQRRVLRDPASDAGVLTGLGRIVACRPAFCIVVGGHPDGVVNDRSSLVYRRRGVQHRGDRRARHQLVGGVAAVPVHLGWG